MTAQMTMFGFLASQLPPCADWHAKNHIHVAVHVDDFLGMGSVDNLTWLHDTLKLQYGLKKNMREPESAKEF